MGCRDVGRSRMGGTGLCVALILPVWLGACDSLAERPVGPTLPDGTGHGPVPEVRPTASSLPDFPPPPGVALPAPARFSGEAVQAASPPPALSGGTLMVRRQGDLAVASDPARDQLHLLDLESFEARSIDLEPGDEPGRVVEGAGGRAHVVLRGAGALLTLDPVDGLVLARTPVCELPRGVAHDAQAGQLHVACADGHLVSLEESQQGLLREVFLGHDLRDVVVSGDGLLVSRFRSAELLDVDARGNVRAVRRGAEVRVPPVVPRELLDIIGPDLEGEEVFPPGLLGDMSPPRFASNMAWRTLSAPDGEVLVVHQRSQVDEIDLDAPDAYGGEGDFGPDPCLMGVLHSTVSRFGKDGAQALPGAMLPSAALPVDMALSPDGETLAVVSPGNAGGVDGSGEGLSQLHVTTRARLVARAPEPGGILDPIKGCVHDAPRSWFASTWSGADLELTAVAFLPDGALLVQSREPAALVLLDADGQGVLKRADLSARSVEDSGHRLFHQNVGAGIACASCHGEVLDDGHVWSFTGLGPRRTQGLRGGLLGREPFHWDGDLATFDDLVGEVMMRRMRSFEIAPQFAEALAQWIHVQPAVRVAGSDLASLARGKEIFESTEAGCVSCHGSDGQPLAPSFDVGTGGPFQVPSLEGLALRAPYMHDGCAQDLSERFEPGCGGDRHGDVSHLDHPQLQDLVHYLETL